MPSSWTIEDFSQRIGLSAHTLRYYERIGLIDRVAREPGGQRRYTDTDLAWVAFLVRLRAARLTIDQMQAFARLRRLGHATVRERREMLESHLTRLHDNIQAMQASAEVLARKIEHYRSMEASDPAAQHRGPGPA